MNDRIVIDPRIRHGKPVIRGTRVPVSIVVGSLAGGMTFEEVEREYSLARDDIRAALKFADERRTLTHNSSDGCLAGGALPYRPLGPQPQR